MEEKLCHDTPCRTICKECENIINCRLGKEILNGVTNIKDADQIFSNTKTEIHKLATTKEKLMYIMSDTAVATFEDIIFRYISEFGEEFPLSRLSKISSSMNEIMFSKTQNYESALHLSRNIASYISRYLNGKMYKDEESMKENIPIQADLVKSIIQYTDKAFGITDFKNKE